MPRVWVSIGSNIDRRRNVNAALADLRGLFGELVVSPVYETDAVGFDGEPFFNLVAGVFSELPPAALHGLMREIENRHGRERGGDRFAARTLDLDVLTYGDVVTSDGGKALPRDDIERYAFVLRPLADVAGDERHPVTGVTYAEMWQRMAPRVEGTMRRVDLSPSDGA